MNQKNNKFNKFLELYESYIDKCDIDNLNSIILIHNKINKYINENKDIEINIINNYLEKNIDNDDKRIKKIITFIELKNKNMIIEAKKLDSWKKTINELCIKYNTLDNNNNNNNIDELYNYIDKIFTKLLLQSKYKFNGNWDVILTNKKGYPTKIELINPNYINIIFENLKKN
jgi:hypothetical protein